MTSHHQEVQDAPASNHCQCPEGAANSSPSKSSGWLSGTFKRCAMCAGSGAGGFLASHAGCIITPFVVASAGATTAAAGLPLIAVAFSAAVTAGGLYTWYRLRGHEAGKWEKRIVIGSAMTGLLVSSIFHAASGEKNCCSTEGAKTSVPACHQVPMQMLGK